jgi:hypothetical protein
MGVMTIITPRLPMATLLAVRSQMLLTDRSAAEVAMQFRVSERTAENIGLLTLDKERCAGCGGLVVIPCLKCFVEGARK